GEVSERGTGADPDDGVAVTTRNLHPAQRRGGLLLKLLPLRPLGLPASDRTPTGAPEGALRAAATAAATATEAATGARAEAATATATTAATTATTTGGGAGASDRAAPGHHARRGPHTTRTGTATAAGTALSTARTGTASRAGLTARTRATGTGHALGGGERVVPGTGTATATRAALRGTRAWAAPALTGTWRTRSRHPLRGGERVVPRSRRPATGAGSGAGTGLGRGRCGPLLGGGLRLGRRARRALLRRRGGRSWLLHRRCRLLSCWSGGLRRRVCRRLGRLLRGRLRRGGGLLRRTGTRLLRRGLLGCRLRGDRFPQPPLHRRFDGRRRGLYELTELVQLRHHGLAVDAKLFRELVDADFCHNSPVSAHLRGREDRLSG